MNQSGRMENVREALDGFKADGYSERSLAAALAEVEEWETRIDEWKQAQIESNEATHKWKARAVAAEADRDEQYQGRVAAIQKRDEFYDRLTVAEADAAEWKGHARRYKGELATALAEADRVHETATIRAATLQAAHAANMKAAEAEADRLKAALEAIVQELSEEHVSLTVVLRIAHAALAPADRNTT